MLNCFCGDSFAGIFIKIASVFIAFVIFFIKIATVFMAFMIFFIKNAVIFIAFVVFFINIIAVFIAFMTIFIKIVSIFIAFMSIFIKMTFMLNAPCLPAGRFVLKRVIIQSVVDEFPSGHGLCVHLFQYYFTWQRLILLMSIYYSQC